LENHQTQTRQEFWTIDGTPGILPPLWPVKKIREGSPDEGGDSVDTTAAIRTLVAKG
jgi:hypothetical protein